MTAQVMLAVTHGGDLREHLHGYLEREAVDLFIVGKRGVPTANGAKLTLSLS